MDLSKVIGLVVSLAIVAIVVWLMIRSWRRRVARDGGLSGYQLPEVEGPATIDAEVLYVATTPADDPLERLAVSGLGFRGTARIRIETGGVTLRVAGEHAVFLPADRLVGASRASWVIDRAVEPGGLVAITWLAERTGAEDAAPTPVASYLRSRYEHDAVRLVDAVAAIATAELPLPAEPDPAEASTAEAGLAAGASTDTSSRTVESEA